MGGKMSKLDKLMKQINKSYGEGVLRKLGETSFIDVSWWDLTSLRLMDILGKGVPKGRIIEIYGEESSGKTSLATYILAQLQAQGETVAFIDAEHSFSADHSENLGLDVDSLYYVDPESGEQALDLAEQLVITGEVSAIVIDSVAALVPQAELDGDMGKAHMGVQARLLGQGLRKIIGHAKKNNTTLIFINQVRMKMGVMYGSPETTPGGKALPFFSSIRLRTRKIEFIKLKDSEPPLGVKFEVKCIKNKVAPPWKKGEFTLMFDTGLDFGSELIEYAAKFDIVDKGGSWFTYNGEKFHGEEKLREYLTTHKEEQFKIEELIKQILAKRNAKSIEDDKEDPLPETVDLAEHGIDID
ncbi:MAG: recombinase RecA [Candidatus Lokiarchaeota archaeon]|nr:recombinase RecA [Candidatus Lokiarchaeota archaeon]